MYRPKSQCERPGYQVSLKGRLTGYIVGRFRLLTRGSAIQRCHRERDPVGPAGGFGHAERCEGSTLSRDVVWAFDEVAVLPTSGGLEELRNYTGHSLGAA